MKLLKLKPEIQLDAFLKEGCVVNYGRTFLYNASEEIKAILERQKESMLEDDGLYSFKYEVIQIINPEQYTYVLLDKSDCFDFSKYFEGVDEEGEKMK